MVDGLLPWNSILTGKRQRPLPPTGSVDYSVVLPTLQTQTFIRADELLKDIMLKIPLQDQPFFTTKLADWGTLLPINWTPDQPLSPQAC